ncbi:glucan exo-1,3-beta-glucosidase RNJ42_01677 [Nakaseomyces bracarensis]|uniref:glucan exo-1,3-beta-glucosidase n=1 Tax=Nakaseomyces bracarensis TaxID=273131 RepID=UPI0038714664
MILYFVICALFSTVLAKNLVNYDIQDSLSDDQLKKLQKRFESYYTDNNVQIKGITVGGWLVTEPYITPSLYETAFAYHNGSLSLNKTESGTGTYGNNSIVDEYTLCQALGYENAKTLLARHFETWITEDDFAKIKEDGFNLVRIPIGYWAWKKSRNDTSKYNYVGNLTYKDPYVSDNLQLSYLLQAISWASKYELNVWIDLHGVPGSQNGFDNSGQRILYGDLGWLSNTKSKPLTIAVWQDLFDKFVKTNNYNGVNTTSVVGIEIVNEPLGPKIGVNNIAQTYYEAFNIFKHAQEENENPQNPNMTFIIHDAFQSIGFWNLHLNPDYKNVSNHYYNLTNITYDSQSILVDHHHYEVFTDYQLKENQYSRITNIINYGNSIHNELVYHPAVVGEWSGALTDCARWVNGIGIGARYDGSYYDTTAFHSDSPPNGTCTSQYDISQWSDDYKTKVRQFIEAQLATYSAKTNGWIFWNWKTENAAEWDYLKLKENELFPSPFDNYTYFNADGEINSTFSTSLSIEAFGAPSSTRASSTKHKSSAGFTKIMGTSMKSNTTSNVLVFLLLGAIGFIATVL